MLIGKDRNMETGNKLLLSLICLCLCSIASAAAPSWIYGETGPSDWTINPPNPGDTDVISFSGPIGFYGNSCFAEADLGGTPMISVDTTNKIIEIWFQGPAPVQCILIYQPVCGLQGSFGPLTPGTWTFRSTVPEIAFERVFTVSGAMGGSTYYVDKDAPGPFHNGTSWKWAFLNLQNALDAVVSGDIILVAEGTYKPDQGDSVTVGDRTATFLLKNGVTVLGGYAGYGQPNPNNRNVETHVTVLNGDLLGDDLWGILNKDDNSYHVVSATGCTSCSSTLDGFTITGGQADGPIPYNAGGGVYIDGANPMLKNCTMTVNVAGFGGAIASLNDASPSVLNCKIIGNSARISGGGLYCFSNNINLTNCLFAGNSAYQAEYLGGSAIYNLGGSLNISDCTIADQSAPNGMAITSFIWTFPAANSLTINNSILYNGGDEILTNHQETISVNNTDIQGGWSGSGTGNINSNPKFVDLGLWGIEGQYIVGDFHLQSSSPCIDKGNNSLLPSDQGDLDEDGNTTEQLPVDLDGAARKQGTKVDMGAYEQTGMIIPEPPDGEWQHLYTIAITHTKIQNNPSASLSTTIILTLSIPFQSILKLEISPASAAGGNWTATFDPDPGIVGPGNVSMTIHIQGVNVDLTQFPSGPNQHIADLEIYIQPL
jgi:hypothetical protein